MTADTVGGVWTYTRELASGLLKRGHRVTLVSFGKWPTPAQTSWIPEHERLTYHPTSFPLEWTQGAKQGIAESEKYLQQVIRDTRPDVLHFSQFCYGALEYGLPKVVVAHSDVISWWNAVHETAPPPSPWITWYQTTVSAGLRRADVVVAPSHWMLNSLFENYKEIPCGRVIYNGRSIELFRSVESKENCVLSVGRVWDHAKQIELLLARNQIVPVKIAGATEHPEGSHTNSVSSSPNLQFCGQQDEPQLCALYASCATYVATSRYEPFGLAPLEAALSGCALIANDIPTFRELWQDSALYFQHNDPESLADAISTLSANPNLRQFYGDRARERARKHFNSDRMITAYEELYHSLVSGVRAEECANAA
jgi:glycosyltransferase involved in cell wall biosynthesis